MKIISLKICIFILNKEKNDCYLLNENLLKFYFILNVNKVKMEVINDIFK